ncbi:hypothetical protein [Cloacibacillus porcorum]
MIARLKHQKNAYRICGGLMPKDLDQIVREQGGIRSLYCNPTTWKRYFHPRLPMVGSILHISTKLQDKVLYVNPDWDNKKEDI